MRWVVFNQKGGVGKSTIVCNLAAVSARDGRRTLVVNQFQPRARLPQRLVDELTAEGLPVLEPFVSSSVKIRESHEAAKPLPYLARSHKLTAQFEALYRTIQKD